MIHAPVPYVLTILRCDLFGIGAAFQAFDAHLWHFRFCCGIGLAAFQRSRHCDSSLHSERATSRANIKRRPRHVLAGRSCKLLSLACWYCLSGLEGPSRINVRAKFDAWCENLMRVGFQNVGATSRDSHAHVVRREIASRLGHFDADRRCMNQGARSNFSSAGCSSCGDGQVGGINGLLASTSDSAKPATCLVCPGRSSEHR